MKTAKFIVLEIFLLYGMEQHYKTKAHYNANTVVWEKFMVRDIHEKKIHGKNFSSKQAIDKNILMPNISYMHMHTYMYVH